jgi:predicted phosphate transport protein (TIGR00153 family)
MKKISDLLKSTMFGPSRNDEYAALLRDVSRVAIECAQLFRKSEGQDVAGIIDLEHKADRLVDRIHEMLDKAFIMRFDIPDAMRLADALDDVIDGMRKVALHIDAYKIHVATLPPEGLELMDMACEMTVALDALVAMLAEPRLSLARVRETANVIDALESKADKIVAAHERKLVEQYSIPGVNVMGFLAWHQLFHLLEQITDDANSCSSQILSLARKEA